MGRCGLYQRNYISLWNGAVKYGKLKAEQQISKKIKTANLETLCNESDFENFKNEMEISLDKNICVDFYLSITTFFIKYDFSATFLLRMSFRLTISITILHQLQSQDTFILGFYL